MNFLEYFVVARAVHARTVIFRERGHGEDANLRGVISDTFYNLRILVCLVFQQRSPANLFRIIKHCLLTEMRLVQQSESVGVQARELSNTYSFNYVISKY